VGDNCSWEGVGKGGLPASNFRKAAARDRSKGEKGGKDREETTQQKPWKELKHKKRGVEGRNKTQRASGGVASETGQKKIGNFTESCKARQPGKATSEWAEKPKNPGMNRWANDSKVVERHGILT